MTVDDSHLPAASHLFGIRARRVLDTAVSAAGGTLHSAGACQVHYAPGSEVVVRYDARVEWLGRPIAAETLIASTTVHGAPAGTTVVEADDMQIGVWRYPFDPRLPGLAAAVTPALLVRAAGDVVGSRPRIDVHVYRPTQRAVARAVDAADREWWVKVVRPADVAALVSRHDALLSAGLPVPRVCAVDVDIGLVILEGLRGRGLRDALVAGESPWPSARSYLDVVDRIAAADVPCKRDRLGAVEAACAHARLLAAVVPDQAARLGDLVDTLRQRNEPTQRRVVHGDLYERQLLVAGDEIIGLVDLDDVGRGEVIDDLANVLAHLMVLAPPTNRSRHPVAAYASRLRADFGATVDLRQLDLRTAAVLLALGTGPFRARQRGWRAAVRRRIDMAMRCADQARESDLTRAS